MAAHDVRYDPAKYLGYQSGWTPQPLGADSAAHSASRSELARYRDPALADTGQGTGGRLGIEWVRPTDLAHRVSAKIVEHGADLHKHAHVWASAQLRDSTRTVSDRVGRLASLSAFGRGGQPTASRDTVGR
jgi:hypothetical protein